MNHFLAALWAETLKARRSKISVLTLGGFLILPLVAGLFMLILKDPERARAMGLISMKARLTGGTAEWTTFFGMLLQGTAVAGAILFAIITAWVFGREFSDHTVKELLALPAPRWSIVSAKFLLTAVWILALAFLIFMVALGIGTLVQIPGWSSELQWNSFGAFMLTTLLTAMLMSPVALVASAGRGYLPPLGFAFLTVALAQITAVMGWGDWFPWAVPALYSGMAGAGTLPGAHSYVLVILTCLVGVTATVWWWQCADQTR